MAARTARRQPNGSVPDATTRQQRAQNTKAQIAQAHLELDALEGFQESYDHADTDPIEGSRAKTDEENQIVYEDGKPVFPTYGEARAEIQARIARLWARAERLGVKALVMKMIEAEQAGEEL